MGSKPLGDVKGHGKSSDFTQVNANDEGQSHASNRPKSCTDVPCCLIFIVCVLGMVGISIFAYVQGDVKILFAPMDSAGNICGYGKNSRMEFLFFFDLLKCQTSLKIPGNTNCGTTQVCVEACPSTIWHFLDQESKNVSRKNMICKPDVNADASNRTVNDLVASGDCAEYFLPSKPVLRRCLPNLNASKTGQIQNEGKRISAENFTEAARFMERTLEVIGFGERMIEDVIESRWYILIGVIGAMVLSFLWIALMAWIAGFIIWVILLCFSGLLGYASYYGFATYIGMKDANSNNEFVFTLDVSYYLEMKSTWLAISCIATIILAIVLLVLLFLRKRIQVAVALIKECGRGIGSMKSILIWPLGPFVFQLSALAMWSTAAIYLLSVGLLYRSSQGISTNATVLGVFTATAINYSTYLQIFNIIMIFWIVNFIVALGRVTVGGSFASYYWSKSGNRMPCCVSGSSCFRAIRYHIGTMALGSLIITIIQLIRVLLNFIEAKLRAGRNTFAIFMVRCLKCCFWCFEKFMKRINDSVYIMVAIRGTNFCVSSNEVFALLSRNVVRLAAVDHITDFIVFIGKIGVMGAISVTAFFFFDGKIPFTESFVKDLNINYSAIPIAVISIFAYIVASAFFNIFSAGVDTLFMCFLVDLDENDGSAEKPYCMSNRLMKILGKKNDAGMELKNDDPKSKAS